MTGTSPERQPGSSGSLGRIVVVTGMFGVASRRISACMRMNATDVSLENRFQSVISQVPTEQQIIPAAYASAEDEGGDAALYDYEPSEEAILEDLLPRGVATQIFSALLENGASEQGARMSAMDNATRNAGDMIERLTIEYNRSRQAVITNELIEIISGAEAL